MGDKNSKFFHASIVIRRKRNKINAIKDGDIWLEDEARINGYFIREFHSLFSFTNSEFLIYLDNFRQALVAKNENLEILSIPSEEEIRDCIWSMHPLKAP